MAAPLRIRAKFARSIQADSLALQRRIARARRAELVRRSAHWPTRRAA